MCGIIGYYGKRDISSVLVSGLERLSYRGYDSSGMAVLDQKRELCTWKKEGKLGNLKKAIAPLQIQGNIGIAHTRWATHGTPSDANAHPLYAGETEKTAIVHNGIIENFFPLRKSFIEKGHVFRSETDSEVLAHMIDEELKGNEALKTAQQPSDEQSLAALLSAARNTIARIEGSYAVACITQHCPNSLLMFRKDSPLLISYENGECVVASDQHALVLHGSTYVSLEDGEIAIINEKGLFIYDSNAQQLVKTPTRIDSHFAEGGDKGEHPHHMIKEIKEQPAMVRRILDHYLIASGGENHNSSQLSPSASRLGSSSSALHFPRLPHELLKNVSRFVIQACGTSWHSGLAAKYWIESHARIWTEVDISSEFRYRAQPIHEGETLVIALSQSGETADTLACVREAKSRFIKVLSFVNVRGSSIDKDSDGAVYSLAGTEIGVASTKNYLAQLLTLYLFSLHLATLRGRLEPSACENAIIALKNLPALIERALAEEDRIRKIADRYKHAKGFVFIGRNLNYPSALEGALKLKEVSYINATGYPAGELKHGPIALIDSQMPTVAIAPSVLAELEGGLNHVDHTYQKMISNMQEVKSREGKLIAIATEGDEAITEIADEVIYIPPVRLELSPLLVAIPLQLLSYHMATLLGCDVDQPKNLAKSVTVE